MSVLLGPAYFGGFGSGCFFGLRPLLVTFGAFKPVAVSAVSAVFDWRFSLELACFLRPFEFEPLFFLLVRVSSQ